jgi:hypothetical protein
VRRQRRQGAARLREEIAAAFDPSRSRPRSIRGRRFVCSTRSA